MSLRSFPAAKTWTAANMKAMSTSFNFIVGHPPTANLSADRFLLGWIPMERETVVITGASAGIGRAIAQTFAKRRARIGLIARGRAGLDAARRDVERLGGEA